MTKRLRWDIVVGMTVIAAAVVGFAYYVPAPHYDVDPSIETPQELPKEAVKIEGKIEPPPEKQANLPDYKLCARYAYRTPVPRRTSILDDMEAKYEAALASSNRRLTEIKGCLAK